MIKKPVILAISGFCAIFAWDMSQNIDFRTGTITANSLLGIPTVQAYNKDRGEVRRTVRRTVRRIDRRHDRYHRSLPRHCQTVFMHGHRYQYCGGIYYQETIHERETVYIIINP